MSPKPSLTIIEPPTRPQPAEIVQSANRQIDYMLQPPPASHYVNRDRIPESLRPLADAYHEATGQEPVKPVLGDWIAELNQWQAEGITPAHVRKAYRESVGRFTVGRPGSLSAKLREVKGRERVRPTKAMTREDLEREAANTVRQVTNGRLYAAEGYSKMRMAHEDPATMHPTTAQLARMYGAPPEDGDAPRPNPAAARAAIEALRRRMAVR